ncbi:hypothetical protein EDB81DRAFT_842443 [Dactylonectria macrodidyma]|uniref:Uncharacterized protein n=1 Tax=Dactylonectria macrodidyma TaxID=307937 RepID=A0A9P9J7J8_9HYPO|nr:hypothetical protein EDB81DRAFT_842443 [Dactylonectria macrodidyma]
MPSDPGDVEEDPNDWRSIKCDNEGVTDHKKYAPDRWAAGWQYNLTAGRQEKHFSNNVSNLFNGQQDMLCEIFGDEGSGCEDLHLQCNSVNYPAGYFIHSFDNIFSIQSNIWAAVNDAVLNNDIASVASDFGKIPVKSSGIAVFILFDIELIAWGLVMGPAWNKLIGPKFSDGSTASTVKDTTNDLVKNSMTLAKDILNSRATDQLGVQNGLEAQMQAQTKAWKDSVLATQKWLFGGSAEGNLQLGNLISDGSLFGDGWLRDRSEHSKQVKRAINAFLITLAWAYSSDVIYPFIATSDVACDKDPGWNDNNSYLVEEDAKNNGRYCHEGNVTNKSGDMWCGKFDSPPGFSKLVDKTYSGISLQNVVVGSINSKNTNGGKNGLTIDIEAPGKEVLETFVDRGIEAPALENYYMWFQNDKDVMTNFPCNP